MISLSSSGGGAVPPRNLHRRSHRPPPNLDAVRQLLESRTPRGSTAVSSSSSRADLPIQSLRRGNWVKLICGASFEDAADVRNLSLLYALAGVDCIDCAADASIVNAVVDGLEVAISIAPVPKPLVMISINDDQADIHFRKAEFDPENCPPDCSRPCERVCPANAISLQKFSMKGEDLSPRDVLKGGVITERCYGCGRCFPICPYEKIRAMTYIRDVAETSKLLKRDDVDAVEIHTSGRRLDLFRNLWNSLRDSVHQMKLIAISLPNCGESTITAMTELYSVIEQDLRCHNLWQLDGRPMSGDIGRGATKEAVDFAISLSSAQNRPPGFLQLAGGTNAHTVDSLKKVGLFQTQATPDIFSPALIGGVAFGGYARKVVSPILSQLQSGQIEDHPEELLMGLKEALELVNFRRGLRVESRRRGLKRHWPRWKFRSPRGWCPLDKRIYTSTPYSPAHMGHRRPRGPRFGPGCILKKRRGSPSKSAAFWLSLSTSGSRDKNERNQGQISCMTMFEDPRGERLSTRSRSVKN